MGLLEDDAGEAGGGDLEELSTEELKREVARLQALVAQEREDQLERTVDAYKDVDLPTGPLDLQDLPPDAALPPGAVPVVDQALKYSNGDTFQGQTIGNKRHGKGLHQCGTGDYYDGEWRNDKRHGKGTMVFVRGLQYEGDWVDDKTEGFGVCTYEDGGKYTGEWKNDHRWGWGLYEMPTGDVYEGEWFDDMMEGRGRYTFADGSYFEGEYGNGERVKGKYTTKDGSIEYIGRWKGGARHGYGVFHQTGLFKYMGEYKDDKRHGKGRCVFADGGEYDGDWHDDVMQGKGKLVMGGETYDGEFVGGLREGQGVCVSDGGDRYLGQWRGGVRWGKGKALYHTGMRYDGEWANDKREGKGTCVYPNRDRYQGEWVADRRHGYGVCVFKDKTKYRGEWEDDCWVQSAADPEFTKVMGPGISRAVAGEDAVFGIEAKDELKNKRLSGGDEFAVMLEGPGGVRVWGVVEDNDDGTYLVRYNATVAGPYQLSVMIGADEHVADSPYPMRVLPTTPFPRVSVLTGDGYQQAVRFNESTFDIEAKDRFGNACGGKLAGRFPIDVSITLGALSVPVEVVDTGRGRYTIRYTPQQQGFYRLVVSSNGVPLGDSPYSLAVREAPQLGATVDRTVEEAETPVDNVSLWEQIAATDFALDGEDGGWDSDGEEKETSDEKFRRENPDVPVIENLEDMYKVGKLQQRKKELEDEEKVAKLQQMRRRLQLEQEVADAAASGDSGGVSAAASSSMNDLD